MNFDINTLIKIGSMGILVVGLEETLRASGKESLAKYITIGGSAITFMIIFKMLSDCIEAIKTTFTL